MTINPSPTGGPDFHIPGGPPYTYANGRLRDITCSRHDLTEDMLVPRRSYDQWEKDDEILGKERQSISQLLIAREALKLVQDQIAAAEERGSGEGFAPGGRPGN